MTPGCLLLVAFFQSNFGRVLETDDRDVGYEVRTQRL